MIDHVVYSAKLMVVGIVAGVPAGVAWVYAQTAGWSVEAFGGVAAFAAIASVGMWRLLKDNGAVADVERQRDYEAEKRREVEAALSKAQTELGEYRSRYGAL